MIDIKNFQSNWLKIEKKSYNGIEDINTYYIGYISIKKFGDYENIHSVNTLYLIIHSTTGHFKEKNAKKYLIINSTDKYEEVLSGVRSQIKTLKMVEKNCFIKKNMQKLKLILTMIYLWTNH